jgi:predicted ATPase
MTALTRPYWIEALIERREGWDDGVYPFNLPAVRSLHSLAFHPNVTFLVGENGSGKSTLIEALAVVWGFNPEGGGREHRFETRASHSPLHRFIRPIRSTLRPHDGFFLRAESFFTTATYLEQAGANRYGDRPLHEQSHGESFLALFQNRFIGDGLYILDEPEAALSPSRQLSLLSLIHDLVLARSQLIIATHSPILLGYPDAWIYQVSEHGIDRVAYEDTDHFQVTRNFLNRREAMLKTLLEE